MPLLQLEQSIDANLEFANAAKATLSKRSVAVLGQYQYSHSEYSDDPVRGALYWERFIASTDAYYPIYKEGEIAQKYADDIARHVGDIDVLVDIGPGSEKAVTEKTLPILNAFSSASYYAPIDICEDYVSGAQDLVKARRPDIRMASNIIDYNHEQALLPKGKKLAISFGSTVSNVPADERSPIPFDEVVKLLKTFGKVINGKGHLIITHDANNDEQSVVASYDHPDQRAFGSNVMYRIQRDLNVSGNFKPQAWKYDPVWHAEKHLLAHTIKATADQTFMIDDELFQIRKGDEFILNTSYKYPVDLFREMTLKAGFETVETYMDDENRMAMHLLKAKPRLV
jgi:uncharacterized SAM-dependent methyltransferase